MNHQETFLKKAYPKKKKKFTFIDLFAGIGGIRIAFENVGGECIYSSEWDTHCQKTYLTNFNELPAGDITKIAANSIPDFDILTAGFPCQPFSSIGKRQGFEHKTQGTLFYDVARIIKTKQPKAFLLENVQGLTTHDKGNTFKTIIETLKELNYSPYYQILNAANFGVPQIRKRIVIVGFRNNIFNGEFSLPSHNGTKRRNIGQYIERNLEGYGISEYLQKSYLFKKADGRPQIVDSDSEIQVKTLVASYHKIQRLTGTFVRDGDTGLRLLSQNECKAIMGFPKDYIVPVSRTQMYRQFGNSVVIPMIQAVAEKMIEKINYDG